MKLIYKVAPVSAYDVRGMESWLEDMARRGLHVRQCQIRSCSFEPGLPRQTRYRIEPCRTQGEEIPRSMVALYRDFGWELVCDLYLDLALFSSQDPDASELHTDPELLGELFQNVYRSKRWWAWSYLLGDIFITTNSLWRLSFYLHPQSLSSTWAPPLIFLPIFAFLSIFIVVRNLLHWSDLRHLSRTVRQLKAGIPLEHRAPCPKRRWINWISLLSDAVFWALLAVALLLFLPYSLGT